MRCRRLQTGAGQRPGCANRATRELTNERRLLALLLTDKGLVGFTVPPTMPSGDHWVRVESIALDKERTVGRTEICLSCARLTVAGGGNGTSGPRLSFPAHTAPMTPVCSGRITPFRPVTLSPAPQCRLGRSLVCKDGEGLALQWR